MKQTRRSRSDREGGSAAASSTRAIPATWTDVRVSLDPSTLVQVTARDSRGRKQYLYHSDLHAALVEFKGERLLAFVRGLPQLRQRVEADLSQAGLPKEKVAAALVRLLEIALAGVGKDEQALRDVKSAGEGDARTDPSPPPLSIPSPQRLDGKRPVDVQHRRRVRVVQRWQDLPGQVPFHYLDDEGHRCALVAADVEDYMQEAAGASFSTKEFRAWAGFAFTTKGTAETEALLATRALNHEVLRAAEPVARRLGNVTLRSGDATVPAALLEAHLHGSFARTRYKIGTAVSVAGDVTAPPNYSGPTWGETRPPRSFAERRAPAKREA